MQTSSEKFWNERYRKVSDHFGKCIKNISGIFVAFNTNMDAIKHVDSRLLRHLQIDRFSPQKKVCKIRSLDNFKTGLMTSMKLGKAMEWEIKDTETYNYLLGNIAYDSHRIGGQAGIVANVLTHLGMKNVAVFNPKLSEAEADMYDPRVKMFRLSGGSARVLKAKDAYSIHDTPKINLVFEFGKGLKVKTKDSSFSVPRMNRFIVSCRPKGREPFFDDCIADNFKKVFKGIKRVFLSGYQALSTDEQFFRAKVQLSLMRKANPEMKMHLEFTSEEDLEKVSKIVKYLLPSFDSLGCNEREMCILLESMGESGLVDSIKCSGYRAPELFEGIRYIKKKTGLKRIHVHNINYMLCLAGKNYAPPEKTRDAMLLCVESAFAKSIKGFIHHAVDLEMSNNVSTNPDGLKQLSLMDKCQASKISEGIYSCGKDYLVMIPTKIGVHAKATVGLGDTVSSTAFVGDLV